MLSSDEKALLGECENIEPVKNFIKQSLEQKAEGETYYTIMFASSCETETIRR